MDYGHLLSPTSASFPNNVAYNVPLFALLLIADLAGSAGLRTPSSFLGQLALSSGIIHSAGDEGHCFIPAIWLM